MLQFSNFEKYLKWINKIKYITQTIFTYDIIPELCNVTVETRVTEATGNRS